MSQQPLPTLTAERRDAIAALVAQEGAVRSAELAEHFDVNVATIRRDLKLLAQQGRVRRVHGGAVVPEEALRRDVRESAGGLEARIGQAVAEMISEGETVFLGPGRLTLAVACSLSAHARLTIVTNGLGVAHWVATNTAHGLIVTGGQVEDRDLGMVGQLTETALAGLRADHVILELGGVSAVGGLTDDSLQQAAMARSLLGIGIDVIVLVPEERVGREAAAFIAPLSEVDAIVTAREAPSAFLWDISESGVRVVLA